jgi:hypothetical protein
MRRQLRALVIGILIGAAPAAAQPGVVAGPTDTLAWDYEPATVVTGNVTRFLVCLTPRPCVERTLDQAGSPTVNEWRYPLPKLRSGSRYTATVLACSPTVCSAASAPLTFTFRRPRAPRRPAPALIGGV